MIVGLTPDNKFVTWPEMEKMALGPWKGWQVNSLCGALEEIH